MKERFGVLAIEAVWWCRYRFVSFGNGPVQISCAFSRLPAALACFGLHTIVALTSFVFLNSCNAFGGSS